MIYIVEDDLDIREMETYALKNSGFDVCAFISGDEFFAECENAVPELVLLDIMLPGDDGLEILRRIREDRRLKDIPVIMVTAKTTELDKVRGLDMGADDYLTKPFGIMELVSRVKALLRRTVYQISEIVCGNITLNDTKRTAYSAGEQVELTYKEFELLKYLLINKDIVLSREKLIDAVWGFDFAGETRTVDMHIKTLRSKLGEQGTQIKTVRNVGYKLEEA